MSENRFGHSFARKDRAEQDKFLYLGQTMDFRAFKQRAAVWADATAANRLAR